ncbi:MAG: EAL domain-containing protein [Burkholderiales bacterium]|nr:EAL domain-containing protein [Burkholderiales bacterium]
MTSDALMVLLVEDNPGDIDLIADMLEERESFRLMACERVTSALDYLKKHPVSLILLDLSLPDSQGLCTFTRIHSQAPHIPIVVLTGTSDETIGLSAVKAGAQDYLVKGRVDPELLTRTITYAVERKRLEQTLGESEERLRNVVDSVREVIFHVDQNCVFTFLNSAWSRILGFDVGDCIGRSFFDYICAEDQPRCRELLASLLQRDIDSVRHELRLWRKDQEPAWVEVDMAISPGSDGQPVGMVGTLNDISQRKKNEERLVFMATHDDLTGLPNRNLFEDRLNLAITHAARDIRKVAVIFLDLDQFKLVNDSMGHDQGDILLRIVASRLLETVRASDTVARLGGDEFVIVLPDLDAEDGAIFIARKVMKAIELPVFLNGQEFFVGGSIGIAMYPKDGLTIRQLVRNADTAMYRSKELGRKQICFYSPEMNEKLLERLMLENDLRRALDKNEFEIFYQPKLSMSSGRIIGFEALLRWRHPARGLIGPEEIIPMAEATGMILPIGSWVLRTSCEQLVQWHRLGHRDLCMAVNLSARQFWQEDLVEGIAAILADTGLAPCHLELEITESSVMRNADDTIFTLRELNGMGITLSIDDFGTGYSSLSYLKRFPIHALKVDQSFVRDITQDADAAAIAQGIIALGHTMNLQVIAEGVETESQCDLLRRWECNAMQGYLFGKPQPGAEAFKMLRSIM